MNHTKLNRCPRAAHLVLAVLMLLSCFSGRGWAEGLEDYGLLNAASIGLSDHYFVAGSFPSIHYPGNVVLRKTQLSDAKSRVLVVGIQETTSFLEVISTSAPSTRLRITGNQYGEIADAFLSANGKRLAFSADAGTGLRVFVADIPDLATSPSPVSASVTVAAFAMSRNGKYFVAITPYISQSDPLPRLYGENCQLSPRRRRRWPVALRHHSCRAQSDAGSHSRCL